MRGELDESIRLQPVQRLPNGRTAYSELLGQFALNEPLSRRQGSAQDQVANAIGDGLLCCPQRTGATIMVAVCHATLPIKLVRTCRKDTTYQRAGSISGYTPEFASNIGYNFSILRVGGDVNSEQWVKQTAWGPIRGGEQLAEYRIFSELAKLSLSSEKLVEQILVSTQSLDCTATSSLTRLGGEYALT